MPTLDEPVTLSTYQTDWPTRFASEQQRLTAALPIASAQLEHIGSTVTGKLWRGHRGLARSRPQCHLGPRQHVTGVWP